MPDIRSPTGPKTSAAGPRLGSPAGSDPKDRTGWSTGVVIVIAATALVAGFGWGRQSAELASSTTIPSAALTTTRVVATTTTRVLATTTTLSLSTTTPEYSLKRVLPPEAHAALIALATSYEAMDRAFDNDDQAALFAFAAALGSKDRALINAAREALSEMFDAVDRAALELAFAASARLDYRTGSHHWTAIDRYLSSVRLDPLSDFDRLLDAMGLRLNTVEVDALLDALKLGERYPPKTVLIGFPGVG